MQDVSEKSNAAPASGRRRIVKLGVVGVGVLVVVLLLAVAGAAISNEAAEDQEPLPTASCSMVAECREVLAEVYGQPGPVVPDPPSGVTFIGGGANWAAVSSRSEATTLLTYEVARPSRRLIIGVRPTSTLSQQRLEGAVPATLEDGTTYFVREVEGQAQAYLLDHASYSFQLELGPMGSEFAPEGTLGEVQPDALVLLQRVVSG